jgi:hypothetical protein
MTSICVWKTTHASVIASPMKDSTALIEGVWYG